MGYRANRNPRCINYKRCFHEPTPKVSCVGIHEIYVFGERYETPHRNQALGADFGAGEEDRGMGVELEEKRQQPFSLDSESDEVLKQKQHED